MIRPVARHLAVAAVTVFSSLAFAQAVDPGVAREQLKQGFALKQQGKYAEALPHLLESLRLDPQAKTLMNLADTEEHLGKLVDAARHWVQARDKAGSAGDDATRAESAKRLTACEARMPMLTIQLKGVEAANATIKRDAVVLGAVSLGVALPSDPGAHVVLVEATGFESRTFDLTLAEGERKTLEVSPGPRVVVASPPVASAPASAAPPITAAPPPAPPPPADSSARGRTQRIGGFVTAGVGVVVVGIAAIEFFAAKSKHDDAMSRCVGNQCDAEAFSRQDDARSAAKLGNVLAVIGGVLVAGGGALIFTAPKEGDAAAASRVTPMVRRDGGGVSWNGSF